MSKQQLSKISVIEAYGLYLITGIAATTVGAAMLVLKDHFGVGIAQIAALSSAFALGRLIMVFFCGLITEHFGVKRAFTIGLTALTINLLFMPISHNYYLALVLMLIAGMGMGFQDSGCPVILSREFSNRYSGAMSAGQAFFGAGCFLPPLTLSILSKLGISWTWMYTIFGLLSLVCLVGTFFMPKDKGRVVSGTKEKLKFSKKSMKNQPIFYIILLIVFFLYSSCINIFHVYTTSYLTSIGIAEGTSMNVLTMFSIGAMIGSLIFIKILEHKTEQSVLLFNLTAIVLCTVVAMVFKNATMFYVTFTIAGAFTGVLFSILVTIATQSVTTHQAMIASLMGFVGGFSDMITPLITGQIADRISVSAVFSYNIIVTSVATVGAFILVKNQKKLERGNHELYSV